MEWRGIGKPTHVEDVTELHPFVFCGFHRVNLGVSCCLERRACQDTYLEGSMDHNELVLYNNLCEMYNSNTIQKLWQSKGMTDIDSIMAKLKLSINDSGQLRDPENWKIPGAEGPTSGNTEGGANPGCGGPKRCKNGNTMEQEDAVWAKAVENGFQGVKRFTRSQTFNEALGESLCVCVCTRGCLCGCLWVSVCVEFC